MSDGVTGLGGVFCRAGDPDALKAWYERLRAAGVEVDDETQDQDGVGRFGWAVDPEGNRFELWEPAEGM
jgi:pentatricopeptide repeat protein